MEFVTYSTSFCVVFVALILSYLTFRRYSAFDCVYNAVGLSDNHRKDSVWDDSLLGVNVENGTVKLEEKHIDTIKNKVEISIYSNESEPPHFKVKVDEDSCRFDMETCEPKDNVPSKIKRYVRAIKKWHEAKKEQLKKDYSDNLADTAPPQARIQP